MYTNCQNFRLFWEIGVEEQDDDVRFLTRSRNVAISLMHSEKFAI